MTNEEAEKEYKLYSARTKLAGRRSVVIECKDGEYALTKLDGEAPSFVTKLDLRGSYNRGTVKIPSTIRTLCDSAFEDSVLSECVIPETVNNLGDELFEGSVRLRMLHIDANTEKLPKSMCRRCVNLEEVKLPDGLTTIGDFCFDGCSSLRDVKLPPSVTTIGADAFSASGLTSIDLTGVEFIGATAFRLTRGLASVVIPSTVKGYAAAFANAHLCGVEIHSKVVSENAFAGNEDLECVILHEGVEHIRGNAFINCKKLKEIILPRSVNYVCWSAFRESGLKRVCLHESFPEGMLDVFKNVHVEFYK